jgi:beta-glucanase (GH16 family)
MLNKNVLQLIRIFSIILLSYVSVSCGSGDGKDPVNASPEDVASGALVLIFEDDFGGPATAVTQASKSPLPVDNWRVETGYGPDNDGNGNDEWQLYQNSIDNLYTENGSLVISAQCSTAPACGKRDDSITSARITSQYRLNVKYGVVQARIKMPSGLGMWPAFWMLGSDFPGLAWPDAGEIDIVEMHYFFSDIQTTHFATHWAGPRYAPGEAPVCASGVGALSPDEQENCATSDEPLPKTFDFPLTDDFHIFELEWTDKVIIGKIDGITYFTQSIDPATMEEFQKDYFLLLNVAVGGTLGGPNGPTMTAADWADPNQTNMVVDWVRVYENVPASTGTLIAESGKNLDFNRIINSAEIGGAFVESDLDSTAVEALEGNEVLSLIYSTAVSENGGIPAGFSGAIFDFNRTDLSSFTKVIFSIDFSQFPGFEDIGIEFQDSRYDPGNAIFVGSVQLRTSAYTPVTTTGNWNTYEIPLSDFAGVNLNDITAIGFFNPFDSSDTLIAGTLYIDDIRFETEECTTTGSVAFDSINYNPETSVASVSVDDICAASSMAVVKVETGTDEIVVGVNLDAAGQGETIFNLVKSDSVCSTHDELSLIKLSSPLMATYTRTFFDADGTQHVNIATATAGIDPSAPGTTIVGEKLFIYATDPAQTLSFVPDTDFFFSDFGTGSQFNGDFTTDTTFSPVFSVSNSANTIAVLALFNFTPGFAANAVSINFKVKDMPNNFIEVSFGDPKTTFPVDLLSYSGSTFIGDGWFEVSIPMTEFPDVGDNTFVQFSSNNLSPVAFTYLITDIFLQESAGNVPAECDNVILPPVAGSGTGATGATGGPFSVSFDDSAVTYSFTGFGAPDTITALNADPVDGTNMVAVTTKPLGAQVWAGVTVETVPGITWPLTAINNQLTIRIYTPGAGVTVLMKLEDSANDANFAEAQAVTTVDTGWETLTFTFVNPPAFTYDKLSLFFGFGTVGDGTAYTWDTIEFLDTVPPPAALPVDFEDAGAPYTFSDFGGGVATVIDNTQPTGNASAKVGQMQKFAGDVFGGSTLMLDSAVDFSAGETFTMKVFSQRVSALTFKLEGLNVERVVNTTGTGWETLTFDFTGSTTGAAVTAITLIFDNGTVGDALNDPTNWTFLFDDIELTAGGGGGDAAVPVDFEDAGAPYTFSDFGGGVATVIDNTQPTGNASAKVGQMQKFAGDVFGGSTLTLDSAVDFSAGEIFTMKVFSQRVSALTFKLEGLNVERVVNTTGTGWETMTFDFTGSTTGAAVTAITLIFDNGTVGDALNDPTNWTFLFDDIDLTAGGGGSGEIAVNGGFETGDFTGWTQFESTPGNQTVNTGTPGDTSSEGTYHLQINNVTAGTNSLVKQERVGLGTVTPGIAWTVTFDARGSFNIGGVAFAQVFSETAGGNEDCTGCGILGGAPLAVNADPTVWTSFSFSGTAGPNTESLTLQLEAVTGGEPAATNMFYDNISFIVGP